MNKEIRAALLQTQKLLGKKFLDDRLRVGSCLADLLVGRYPGERRLLLLLMEADIPGMIQRGQVNGENVASKARYLAQTYYADEAMLIRGIRVWHAVLKGTELPEKSAPPQSKPAPKSPPPPTQPNPIVSPRTSPALSITPTAEQERAIHLFSQNKNLKINAYAGTGKTSTLLLLAHSTARKGQYLAFNKRVVDEAKQRFPRSVKCSSSHSLAFHSTIPALRRNRSKMNGKFNENNIIELLKIEKNFEIDNTRSLRPLTQAALFKKTVERFLRSSDKEIMEKHIPTYHYLTGITEQYRYELTLYVLKNAEIIWNMMKDPNHTLPIGHDGYLKLWALSDPVINADYIMLDEAQDSNPALLGVLLKQQAQIVYVGDRYQQIYEWRGAVNAMENIHTDLETSLITSFRFGTKIADFATAILKKLGADTPLTGNIHLNSRLCSTSPNVILTRTNAYAMSEIISALDDGRKPHYVGGTEELKTLLFGIKDLMRGKPCTVPEFFGFNNWDEVIEFSETPEGEYLKPLVNLTQKKSVNQLLWATYHTVDDENNSDITISTAHRSKGREWNNVRISGDFLQATNNNFSTYNNDIDFHKSELRLFYVAATRAKLELDIEPDVLERFNNM